MRFARSHSTYTRWLNARLLLAISTKIFRIGNEKMHEPQRRYRNFDHLILGTPSLESTVALLHKRLGSEPYFGGSHPKHGTSNYLLPMGGRTYLEIIGASSPKARLDKVGRQLECLEGPRLIGIALETNDMARTLASAQSRQITLDISEPGERRTASGALLQWEAVNFNQTQFGEMLFFAIDWKGSSHPSESSISSAELTSFEIRSEASNLLQTYCALLDCDLVINETTGGTTLSAQIQGPHGSLSLSSEQDPT